MGQAQAPPLQRQLALSFSLASVAWWVAASVCVHVWQLASMALMGLFRCKSWMSGTHEIARNE